jgi:hypothetical protein
MRPPELLGRLAMVDAAYAYGKAPPWGETVALETLIEYAVATYGNERLPMLLDTLTTHDNWIDLIPAVFSVSAAKFERDWQAYVVEQYAAASTR